MNESLLKRYIRLIIAESPLARVPTQLLPPDEDGGKVKSDDEQEELEEFSGAGAIAGYTAPLGMSKKDKKGK